MAQLDEAIALTWGQSSIRLLRGTTKDWLRESGLVQLGNDVLIVSSLPEIADLVGESSRYASDARLYTHLLLHGFDGESDRLSRAQIERNLSDFRAAPPDKSEGAMKKVVSTLLECLGFTVQHRNGPREALRTSDLIKLDFGSQGDDLAAIAFLPFSSGNQDFVGLSLAAELKRTFADKKSVTQALAVRDRLTEFHRSQLLVLPIVVSGDGSGRFSDAAARSYAHSSRVALLTIDHLIGLVHEQRSRFIHGQDLILPVDLYIRLHTLVAEGEVELYPTSLRFPATDEGGANADD